MKTGRTNQQRQAGVVVAGSKAFTKTQRAAAAKAAAAYAQPSALATAASGGCLPSPWYCSWGNTARLGGPLREALYTVALRGVR